MGLLRTHDYFLRRNGKWRGQLYSVTFFLFISFNILLLLPSPLFAQTSSAVQIVSGWVERGTPLVYRLPNLQAGDTLYLQAGTVEGNLDPFIGIASDDFDLERGIQRLNSEVDRALQGGRDPLLTIATVVDEEFLAWNDDGGEGYSAELIFTIPDDGNYQLLLGSSPMTDTFGTAKMAIGLNDPKALKQWYELEEVPSVENGELRRESEIAILDESSLSDPSGIQEVFGSLSVDKTRTFFTLENQNEGTTLYAYVQAISGNLHPILHLRDFGNKLLSTANFLGRSPSGHLEYAFTDTPSKNFRLEVLSGKVNGQPSTGDFRLLAGIDRPEVLNGSSTADEARIFRKPIEVDVGVNVEQIADINQKNENYGIVATLNMEWFDPNLVFSADECQCRFKEYSLAQFEYLIAQNNLSWPNFTITNQQGRRFSQNQIFIIFSTGEARYIERFSATLQAPDFDFRFFPFDRQTFFINIQSVFPEEFYKFNVSERFSGLGERLGEEEWVASSTSTSVSSELSNAGVISSQYSFEIEAYRQLNYYILRIFIPVGIIIFVSWVPSFLGDYNKRVDIANATLLLFIAFNFTISNDLPRLGYLTFIDTLLLSTFILTGVVLIYNVILKRLESDGKKILVRRIDRYAVWLHPLTYFAAFALVTLLFT
ncbi:MAG: hypothetical protein AB4040_11620 [Synechococcus sp.]